MKGGPGEEGCRRYKFTDPLNQPLIRIEIHLSSKGVVGISLSTSTLDGTFGLQSDPDNGTEALESVVFEFEEDYPVVGIYG